MPYQNRVTPAGDIIATSARGTFMGNRGCLHDDKGWIRRPYQLKRWIICVLEFKNRKRPIMRPGHYTELFFLDEAVALAAGHRPCAECQRERYTSFMALWAEVTQHVGKLRADDVDAVLHQERLTQQKTKRTYPAAIHELPDGVFVHLPDDTGYYLLWQGRLLRWSEGAYIASRSASPDLQVTVLTPASTVAVLKAGYLPNIHLSAFPLL